MSYYIIQSNALKFKGGDVLGQFLLYNLEIGEFLNKKIPLPKLCWIPKVELYANQFSNSFDKWEIVYGGDINAFTYFSLLILIKRFVVLNH